MTYTSIDNRFQQRLTHTPSPSRLDYDRALPPLADQPLLELKRPSNKDACFSVSALSPKISKRAAANSDFMSGRACLLDRFLSQQECSPVDGDLPQNPSKLSIPTPNNAEAILPASSNDLWTVLSQRRAQNYSDRLPARLTIDTSQRVNNQRHVRQPIPSPALSTESAPVIGNSGSHASPDLLPSQYRQSRRYIPQPMYSPALSTESTPVMGHSHPKASYYSPTLSTESAPMTERTRSYFPVSRLEGFPIPRAPSMERRSAIPAPLDIAATQDTYSRKGAFRSPLGSADTTLSFASQTSSGSQAFRAPHPKLNKLVTLTNPVRFNKSDSPGTLSMRSLAQTEQGFSSPSTTFSFSPVTPVAMTFDYPLIFQNTSTLDQGAIPKTHRSAWKDDCEPYREVAELRSNMEIKGNAGAGLDRTARWVMSSVAEEESKNALTFASVASDREAIMRSYFQQL